MLHCGNLPFPCKHIVWSFVGHSKVVQHLFYECTGTMDKWAYGQQSRPRTYLYARTHARTHTRTSIIHLVVGWAQWWHVTQWEVRVRRRQNDSRCIVPRHLRQENRQKFQIVFNVHTYTVSHPCIHTYMTTCITTTTILGCHYGKYLPKHQELAPHFCP